MAAYKYYVKGFVNYCKENISVCLAAIVSIIIVYGVKLLNISIDLDGSWYLNREWSANMLHWIGQGRWGISFIKLFRGQRINYYLDTSLACMFLALCALLFCYLLNSINRNKSKWPLTLFASFFVISPTWVEMNYNNFMSVEVMISIVLCPLVILLLLCGIKRKREERYTIFATLLAILATSTYQANWCLLMGAISAVLILIEEQTSDGDEGERAQYKRLWYLSYGVLTVAGVGYFISNKIVQWIFHSSSEYVSDMIHIGERGYWFLLCKFFYKIFFADFTPLNETLKAILARYVEKDILANISWNVSSSAILHLPLICCFVIMLVRKRNKSLFLWISSGGVILSVLLLGILGGNVPGRSLYALPFVGAFLIYYVLTHISKRGLLIVAYVVVTLGTLHQARKSAMILYSDYRRYEWDVSTLENIVDRIEPLMASEGENGEEKQLLVVGGLKCPLKDHFLHGECIGDSLLENLTVEFLYYMGYKYLMLDNNKVSDYLEYVKYMPSYPAQGCVKEVDDVVVLKLSDDN